MPQEAWSEKRERQYQHIKQSEMERGKSEDEAEEIAARTVNQDRKKKDQTKQDKERTEGTGNPNTSLEDRTKEQLYNRAKELDIDGRSQMSKDQLVRAIRKAS